MTRHRPLSLFVLIASGFLAGCVDTPRQPVLRPIPPPPPTPPPGIVSTQPGTLVSPAPPSLRGNPTVAEVASTPTNASGLEVTSNFVANAQSPATIGNPTAPAPIIQSNVPQYEEVPPRPGPDYQWQNGYWRWDNAWVWVPGQWILASPSVIIVPEGRYYYHRRYGPDPWRYRRW